MGQYYKIMNLDKNQYLYSHDFDCGLKLMESSYIGDDHHSNGYMETLTYLIQNEWKGDRIVMVGDYAGTDWAYTEPCQQKDKQFYINLMNEKKFEIINTNDKDGYEITLYNMDEHGFENYLKTNTSHNLEIPRYLCNEKTKEYVDLYHLPVEWSYSDEEKTSYTSIYPLPLLIVVGNGQGGGDYFGQNQKYVGYWCDSSEHIFFSNTEPENYKPLPFIFCEQDKLKYKEDYIKENKLTYEKLIEMFYQKYDRLTYQTADNFYAYLGYEKEYTNELEELKITSTSDLVEVLLELNKYINEN